VLDHAGRLFVTGRLKHVIDVGGLKVNPQEVEAALGAHPGVAECVVVPIEASDTVTRLRAVFVARDPANPPASPELRGFLRDRLSAHKVPRTFEAVASLPRSATGKILRSGIAGRPC
jgi:acyl-coenzyme A synthetase/AMP-(fatty) acid ligase